jgi:hypothetical protein
MRRTVIRSMVVAAAAAAYVAAAMAQQALQCVNPDVLNSLVFNGRAESRVVVTRSMPGNPAGFQAPPGFTLIGSGVSGQGISTRVAYKTTLESAKALDSLIGFLAQQGWSREATPQDQPASFPLARPQTPAAMLCRNGERRIVGVEEGEAVRYAIIIGANPAPPRACGALNLQQGFGQNPRVAFDAARAVMPQFSFPDSARMNGRPSDRGTTGLAESSMRIESPDSAATIAGILARQLREQGWRVDSEWKGALSTGSMWVRKADAGPTYWGTLEVLNLGSGTFEVSYSAATRRQ